MGLGFDLETLHRLEGYSRNLSVLLVVHEAGPINKGDLFSFKVDGVRFASQGAINSSMDALILLGLAEFDVDSKFPQKLAQLTPAGVRVAELVLDILQALR
jgi:hypothetical protein